METTALLSDWSSKLRERGFAVRPTGGRRGIHLARAAGPTTQTVAVLVSDSRDGAFNIQLNVTMPLPYAENPHDVIVLSGDVGRGDVTIIESWVHDPRLITWWPKHQRGKAWLALTGHGLNWLQRFSSTGDLIDYFEESYRRFETVAQLRPSLATRVLQSVGLATRPQATAHYEYLLWLALLYEAEGDIPTARDRLATYAAEVARRGVKSEVARLARHEKALDRGGNDRP